MRDLTTNYKQYLLWLLFFLSFIVYLEKKGRKRVQSKLLNKLWRMSMKTQSSFKARHWEEPSTDWWPRETLVHKDSSYYRFLSVQGQTATSHDCCGANVCITLLAATEKHANWSSMGPFMCILVFQGVCCNFPGKQKHPLSLPCSSCFPNFPSFIFHTCSVLQLHKQLMSPKATSLPQAPTTVTDHGMTFSIAWWKLARFDYHKTMLTAGLLWIWLLLHLAFQPPY